MKDETLIRIMVYEIREKHPDAVRFNPTPKDIKSILLYMQTRKYDKIMYMYGYKFLLKILELFEDVENYEECFQIVEQIRKHNNLINDNIPTK